MNQVGWPLWLLFFNQSLFQFWRILPVPLCLNYLPMLSWDAIIQTLIPCNFHTSICTLAGLTFTNMCIYCRCFFPSLEDQRRISTSHDVRWYTTKVQHFILAPCLWVGLLSLKCEKCWNESLENMQIYIACENQPSYIRLGRQVNPVNIYSIHWILFRLEVKSTELHSAIIRFKWNMRNKVTSKAKLIYIHTATYFCLFKDHYGWLIFVINYRNIQAQTAPVSRVPNISLKF